MKYLDINTWNRKEHYKHFKKFKDPYFGIIAEVDVTKAYNFSKENDFSFFVLYLHSCMKAVNSIENFKYRIIDDKIAIHDIIHAAPTIARPDTTFGFSFVHFSDDLYEFNNNFLAEKHRVLNSTELYSPILGDNCIHCSAIPWVHFTGHKDPASGEKDHSIPKISFSKFRKVDNTLKMSVAVKVNHALMDGYHVSQFFIKFQEQLNKML